MGKKGHGLEGHREGEGALSCLIKELRGGRSLLWEQEIGSSNLSTPTLEETHFLLIKALSNDEAFFVSSLIITIHLYPKVVQKKSYTPTYTHTCGVFCLWDDC